MTRIEKETYAPHWLDIENGLIMRIHRKIGGRRKLAALDDPTLAREIVLKALADVSASATDKNRISDGDLNPLERRVVRKVTNRCAAGRSRTRRQKEVVYLRDELCRKQRKIVQLQIALRDAASFRDFGFNALDLPPMSASGNVELPINVSVGLWTEECTIKPSTTSTPLSPVPRCPLDVASEVETEEKNMLWSLIDELGSPIIEMADMEST